MYDDPLYAPSSLEHSSPDACLVFVEVSKSIDFRLSRMISLGRIFEVSTGWKI